jgi:GntR family carbon starvation induced transcriptional regulator
MSPKQVTIPRTRGQTIATSVYDRLRLDIISGELAPGVKLPSAHLRERYQAGISPVREALNRLVAESLVCFEDQKGFHVAGVGSDDLADLIQTRCWIEEIALRESIRNADGAWEDALVVAFHHLSRVPRSASSETYEFNPEWERHHRAFHMALIENCGSQRMLAYCELLADQSNRYRQLAAAISYPTRNERDEHEALMNAAIARDVDVALALYREHLRLTHDIIARSEFMRPNGKIAL